MSNQQTTGSPWSQPAGKTPYYGAPSNALAGGYSNTAPGAPYNHVGAGTTAPAAFTPTPPPKGGPTIAQSGSFYAPAHAGAPTMVAHFPTGPVAPAPAPLGATYAPSPLGATYAPPPSPGATYVPPPLWATYAPPLLGAAYTSPPRTAYAASPLGAAYAPPQQGTPHAPTPGAPAHMVHPANAPHAAPGYAYPHPPPQPPYIPTGGRLTSSMQNIPPPPPPRAALPYAAHATAPPTPPLAPYPTRLPTKRHNSLPPPPPRPTTSTLPPLHHGGNRPILQRHPAHRRPVRHGYRRTGFMPPIQGRCQP